MGKMLTSVSRRGPPRGPFTRGDSARRVAISHGMGVCMKTTVEISDALLEEARRAAARDRTTVRALIEDGLRQVLGDRRRKNQAFTLRRATFKGEGLQPHVMDSSWERLRDITYEGRGV